jgi:hypothetical protein
MDRTTLLDHLAKTIRDVEESERQIVQQREIMLKLDHAGRDGSDARSRLALLEEIQRMHVWDKRRTMMALSELSSGGDDHRSMYAPINSC